MKVSFFIASAVAFAAMSWACENTAKIPLGSTQETITNAQPGDALAPLATAMPTVPDSNPSHNPTPLQITIAPPAQGQPSATPVSTAAPVPTAQPPTVSPMPLRVGAGLPDFTLPVATGGTITLSEYIGKKNVVLVFYRAWWCLYCRDQLIELRNHHREIMAQDAVVLAVSTDNLDGAKYAVETFAAPYAILYDVTTQVPRQYNVFNLHGDNLASASIFIIDKTGQLRFKEVGEVYTHQVTSAKIVAEIKKFHK